MKTILLVDDDPQIRSTYGVALRSSGYQVIEADSGVAGLTQGRQFLPDLILSDIQMPGGSGATLLEEIRRDPELRSKQVVLMTGQPDLISPRKGMEAGADDFLVKPFTLEELLNCVKARIERASVNWRVEDDRLHQLRSAVPSHLPHEFFTPLAGIIGLMEILRSSYPILDPAEVTEIHNDVYQSSIRLHHTLRNYLLILDLQDAQPQSLIGPMTVSQVEGSIQNGIKEALRLNKRKADLTSSIDPWPILIKPADLTLIVEELVDNAFKFSRNGTPVKVEFTPDRRLTVVDQGRGMTPDELSRIGAFKQFERHKQEQQGLGLGLVLVVKLASLYNAEFSMTSQPGIGTTVSLLFPFPERA